MTNIILHGILAQEFGANFKMKIYKAANVIKAIDVNRKNFNKRIFELSREGLNYTMIVDGKKITELQELNIQKEPQEIHLVPMIIGSGPANIGNFIIQAVLYVTSGGGAAGTAAASAFAAQSAVALSAASITASTVGAVALTAASIGLQMLLSPKPDAAAPISASTKAMSESFSFSNKANLATQGSPIPIGYGRLKVGSQVIQMTVKSYQQNQNSETAMQQKPYISNLTDINEQPQSISSRA